MEFIGRACNAGGNESAAVKVMNEYVELPDFKGIVIDVPCQICHKLFYRLAPGFI